MSQLLMHPRTRLQLESFVASPSHAVIIQGPSGSGKGAVSRWLSQQLLELGTKDFSSYPYGRVLEPKDGKPIGIEDIRGLDEFLSLKVPVDTPVNRIIIIENSDSMAHEAQNALLKTLEEPPQGTVLVLTASYAEGLLPTIRSRAQSITVQAPAINETKDYFYKTYETAKVDKAVAIAGGLPGLLSSMLEDADHPLMQAVEQAKKYVQSSTYERLIQTDVLSKDRKLTEQTLYVMQQMAHISLQSASNASAKRWQKVLEASYDASKALRQNGQIKLVLTDLALKI
jgi:DNA polymerase-3 subunit delta'